MVMRKIANLFMLVQVQHRLFNLIYYIPYNVEVKDKMSMQYESNMNNYALSFPCIYPVCPISIDHTRLYVVGDVIARYARSCRKTVMFPLGFHYSGLTAHKFQRDLSSIDENNTKRIFRDFYKCDSYIINYLKQS